MFEQSPAPICIGIAVIFVSGILGGTVNYFLRPFSRRWNAYKFFKSVLSGLLFSAIVMFVIETFDAGPIESNQPFDYVVSGVMCLLGAVVFSVVEKWQGRKPRQKI